MAFAGMVVVLRGRVVGVGTLVREKGHAHIHIFYTKIHLADVFIQSDLQ